MISNRSVPTDVVLPHIAYRDVEQAISSRSVLLSITAMAIQSAERR